MPYTLKNLSSFPLDISTMSGPVILPAGGEVIAELGALDAEVMRQSPYVELTEGGKANKPDPLDHDKDGKKGGSKPAEESDELAKLRADYLEVVGKKPYHGWSAEELQSKIDEKLAE